MDNKKPNSLSTSSRVFTKRSMNTSSRTFNPSNSTTTAPTSQISSQAPSQVPQQMTPQIPNPALSQSTPYYQPSQSYQNTSVPQTYPPQVQTYMQPNAPMGYQGNSWPSQNLGQSTIGVHQTQYQSHQQNFHHNQSHHGHSNHRGLNNKKEIPVQLNPEIIKKNIFTKILECNTSFGPSKTEKVARHESRHHYSLEVPEGQLQEFTVPEEDTTEKIFSLYFSVPKEEEKKRKLEEEKQKLREEEEKKQKEIARHELMEKGVNLNLAVKERVFSTESELEEILEPFNASDTEFIKMCISTLKKGKNISVSQLKEFQKMSVTKNPSSLCVQESLINRKCRVQDYFGGGRKNNYRGNNRRDRGDRRDKYDNRDRKYNNRGPNSGGGGFSRKELTEEQKKMQNEASNLKKVMADRRKAVGEVEVNVKLLMNKITPENQKSCRKQIEEIIRKNDFNQEVLEKIGLIIFKKACVEKKYTQMYSDLCLYLTRIECKEIIKRYEKEDAKNGITKEETKEEQKRKYDEQLAKLQEQLEKGIIDEIPADMKKFKYKKPRSKAWKSYKKESHIRESVTTQCRLHVEDLAEDEEPDKSDPDWEDKYSKYRAKKFGNIRFVGELFNKDFFSTNLLLRIFDNNLLKIPRDRIRSNEKITGIANDMVEASCILCVAIGKNMEEQWEEEGGDLDKSIKKSETKKGHKTTWERILKDLHEISLREDLIESRTRILIKNTFTTKESGWKNDKDEGPLKLKELHKKVRKEQEGGYEEEYEKPKPKPKPKREEKKQKHGSGGTFFGMADFEEIEDDDDEDDDDDEEEKVDTHQSSADERFKDINDDKLSDICIGNFKEYLDHEEFAFETFQAGLKAGISKGQFIFALFYKLFDNDRTIVDKFDDYLIEFIKQIEVNPSDITEGLTKYNIELVNLECDYPFVDRQYSKILYALTEEDLIEYDQIKWYSPEDEMSDIFFKIFIRLAERKYIDSDHEKDELRSFIQKHGLDKILESIKEYLLEEDLLKDYHSEIKESPLSDKLNSLNVCAHTLIYTELGLQ
ncbi:unnamed protein product [Moneuplotes crassus]|uniref:MIF4G domain-containing protein n=1 Tax=Euplotes crassus TaxID=5936 RepID=A0AAD1UMH8_EUPCR|nr:unnamed protein product [Moneuplotes crassus]